VADRCRCQRAVPDRRLERGRELAHAGASGVHVHLDRDVACGDHLRERRAHHAFGNQDERRPQRGVAGERKLPSGHEDPKAIAVVVEPRDERGLGEADLPGDRLHHAVGKIQWLGYDAQLVARQRTIGEHVDETKGDAHRARSYVVSRGRAPARLSLARV
jgi:hypothetical protein